MPYTVEGVTSQDMEYERCSVCIHEIRVQHQPQRNYELDVPLFAC
jgi:hypothetical protein